MRGYGACYARYLTLLPLLCSSFCLHTFVVLVFAIVVLVLSFLVPPKCNASHTSEIDSAFCCCVCCCIASATIVRVYVAFCLKLIFYCLNEPFSRHVKRDQRQDGGLAQCKFAHFVLQRICIIKIFAHNDAQLHIECGSCNNKDKHRQQTVNATAVIATA